MLEWDISGDAGIYSYYDIERTEVGGGSSCEDFSSITATHPLGNNGWNNQFNVGGNGFTGDGELCFTVNDIQGFERCMIGLNADPFTNASYASIDHAMYIWRNGAGTLHRIFVFENRSNKGLKINQSTSFEGQTLCIKRTGTTIEYLLDGTSFYTSATPNSAELFFDNSFLKYPNSSVTVSDINICTASTAGPET